MIHWSRTSRLHQSSLMAPSDSFLPLKISPGERTYTEHLTKHTHSRRRRVKHAQQPDDSKTHTRAETQPIVGAFPRENAPDCGKESAGPRRFSSGAPGTALQFQEQVQLWSSRFNFSVPGVGSALELQEQVQTFGTKFSTSASGARSDFQLQVQLFSFR